MPHWLIKSAIQRAISLLPQSHKYNEWFQQNVTKSLGLGPGDFELKVGYCRRALDDLLELRPDCANTFTALELGTGWYPTVPIGLYLCGASDIWSFDIFPSLNRARLKMLLQHFCEFERDGRLQKILPRLRPERAAKLHEAFARVEQDSPQELLERFNVHIRVADARSTGLPSKSVDLFFSSAVLQHIPPALQQELYSEFRRVASPGAVAVHYIDLKDQFASFDRSITPLNFLQYSTSAWNWFGSPLTPQTRLRISDYRAQMNQAGFAIKKEKNVSASAAVLEKIRLAPDFKKYSREDLLVIETWLVAVAP